MRGEQNRLGIKRDGTLSEFARQLYVRAMTGASCLAHAAIGLAQRPRRRDAAQLIFLRSNSLWKKAIGEGAWRLPRGFGFHGMGCD
jgi:hypothetical protein